MNPTLTLNRRALFPRSLQKAAGLALLTAAIGLSASQKASAQAPATQPVTITGNIYDDANGTTDGIINGTGISALGSSQLYVYLTVASGGSTVVTAKSAVGAGGAYSITGVNNTNYAIILSTSNVNVNDVDPGFATPAVWVATAEGYLPGGEPNGSATIGDFTFTFTTPNTPSQQQSIYFGVDRRPAGNNYTVSNPMLDGPNGGRMLVPAAAITGSDLEDGAYPTGLTGRTVELYAPVGADLYYNNNKLTFTGGSPIRIPTFNVNQLTVDANFGATSAQFYYRPVDNADVGALQSSTVYYPIVLLVKLTSFDVLKIASSSARIKWETATEIDNDYFDVQRSTDGRSFASIARVHSKTGGASSQPTSYEMVDNALPQTASVYYRLRIVDIYGKEQYSSTVRVAGGTGGTPVVAFPNPAVDVLHFNLASFAGTNRINILDGSGKVVASSEAEGGGNAEVSLSNLPAGRYFYQISNGQNTAMSSFVIAK